MKAKAGVIVLLLLASFVPYVSANEASDTIEIFVDWTDGHAYLISGDVDISNVSATHIQLGTDLNLSLTYDTTGENLRLILDSNLMYGDTITITAGQTSRIINVGIWGQPLDDHEVTLNSEWVMDQQWENENGSQAYILEFNGQGWQQRVGNTLDSWERGNGSLYVLTNTEEGSVSIDVDLDTVWKNETSFKGEMTAQVFEARGSGIIGVGNNDSDGNMNIQGEISDAWINRSTINGIIDERFRLEANGTISMFTQEDDETMNLSGYLAVLLIETWDSNGERILSHNQFEGSADLMMETNDTRMDIYLETFENVERWENGERVDYLNKMIGDGTFGFAESDENASVQINGTIHDFHQESLDGIVIEDTIHIDGIIVGDVQGTFGFVRGIEGQASQANATGVMYDVIIVHQEEWFNLTGITALPNSNLGAGQHHNESWSYDSVYSDYENRTIRTVWIQEGPDPSSGDEIHENSPIEVTPTPPEVEDDIGAVEVNRETGFMPTDATVGDTFLLDGQDGMHMEVTCLQFESVPMDGHIVDTVYWTGEYMSEVSGEASGNLIIQGPLSGLNVKIDREFMFEFGDDGQMVNLTENQSVNRVLSPSVISANENTAPIIESIALTQGLVFNEGGAPAYLEVQVSDAEFNVESVEVDTYSIGGVIVQLNDKGLDGDRVIGDDIWTCTIIVPGLEFGELQMNVTAIDAFENSSVAYDNITVLNQPPRLLAAEMVPTIIHRNQMMIINLDVFDAHGVESVAIDMREYDGELVQLTELGMKWVGEVTIPVGMSPGEHEIKVLMTDDLGAFTTVTRTSSSGQSHVYSVEDYDLEIRVENEPPVLVVGDSLSIERGDDDIQYVVTIGVEDYDGINSVKVKLGNLAPPGGSLTWYTMTNNGDGTFSYEFTIKKHIPLGGHELMFKATDTFGSKSSEESLVIQLVEEDTSSGDTVLDDASNTMTVVAIAGIGILLVIGAVVYVMRGSDSEEGGKLGGFGDS